MGPSPHRPSRSPEQFRRWVRLSVATVTSTAMVGGALVAVPAHPLNPVTQVASAQEAQQNQNIARAQATALDLSLLSGFVTPESLPAFNEALTLIESQQAWPADEGSDPDTSALTLELLQTVNLNLGGLTLPLVDDGSGSGLLDLGTGGVGVLGAFASAPGPYNAHGAAGVVSEDGAIDLDPEDGAGNVETNIQLTALLDQLGLSGLTDGLVDDLSLRLGAVSSSAEKSGDEITAEYAAANAQLYLHSPVLDEISGLLGEGGIGADIDALVASLAGNESLLGALTGILGVVLDIAGSGVELSLSTNIEGTLQALLVDPLYDGATPETSLVYIDLGTGTIQVNLEQLHGENLSQLDPNTPLVSGDQIDQIVATIAGLLDGENGLVQRIQNTVSDGLLATQVNLNVDVRPLFLPLASVTIEGSLQQLLDEDDDIVDGGGLLGGLLADVVGTLGNLGGTILTALRTPVQGLLGGVLGLVSQLVTGLDPLLRNVLGNVVQVTVNSQPNELQATNDVVPGRPNAVVGEPENPDEDFTLEALRVQVLGLGTGGGVIDVPLAISTINSAGSPVIAEDGDAAIGLDPQEGPTTGSTEVTMSGDNLVFENSTGELVGVTEVNFNGQALTGEDITLNADGTVTFTTPSVSLEETGPVDVYAVTPAGDSNTVQFTYTQADTTAPVITAIEDQTGTVDEAIDPIEVIIDDDSAVTVTVEGLPAGLDYNDETNQIEGTPTEATSGDEPAQVTVTAVDEAGNEAEPVTFSFIVTDGVIPVIIGDPVAIERLDEQQDTEVDVTNFNPDESIITAADENGSPVDVEVAADGSLLVTPDENIGDQITVTITDPDLVEDLTVTVPVVDPATEADLFDPSYGPVAAPQDEETLVDAPSFTDENGAPTDAPAGTAFTREESTPTWVAVDASGSLVLTPSSTEDDDSYAEVGETTIPVTVTYPDNSTETVNVDVTVGETLSDGLPPILTGDPAIVERLDEQQDTEVDVTNFNPDESTITAADENGNPVEVTVDDDGNILVTPEETTGDTITVTITDPDLDEEETFDVQVVDPATEADLLAPTYDPVIVAQDETTTVSSPTFTNEAGATVEPEGTTFAAGDNAPAWATVNNDGSINLAPSSDAISDNFAEVGPITIPVTVTYADGSTDEIDIDVEITETELTVADGVDPVYQPISIAQDDTATVATPDFVDPETNEPVDLDLAEVSFTAGEGFPAWATLNNDDGSIMLTPSSTEGDNLAEVGPATISVTVTYADDSTDEVAVQVNITETELTIADGVDPVYTPATAQQDETTIVEAPTFVDPETNEPVDPVNLAETPFTLDEGAPGWATIDEATGEITLAPVSTEGEVNYAPVGETTIPVIVTYADGSADNVTVPVSITETPDTTAPVITPIDNQTGTVGEEITPIEVIVEDNSDGPITVTVTGLPDGLTYDADIRVIEGTPIEATEDIPAQVTITAEDGASNIAEETFVFAIAEASDGTAPEITGVAVEVPRTGQPEDTGIDIIGFNPEESEIAAVDNNDAEVTVTVDEDGSILVTPTSETGDQITVTITDPDLENPQSFTIDVIDPALIAEGYEVTYPGAGEVQQNPETPVTVDPVFTDDNGGVIDVPVEVTGFTLASDSPNWVTIDETTGIVTLNPDEMITPETYNFPVTVTYTDDSTDTAEVTATVTAADLAGAFGPDYPEAIVEQGQSTTIAPTFDDPDTDEVETMPEGAVFTPGAIVPDWATINETTGEITLAPGADIPTGEDYTVDVEVSYTDGTSETVTIPVTITDTTAPVLETSGPITGNVGTAIDPVTITANEEDVTFSANNLPAGLSIDPNSGEITGTPEEIFAGTITVVGTDAADNTGEITVTVAIDDELDTTAPVITAIEDQTGVIDEAIDPIAITVDDDSAVTVAVEGLPAGLEYNPETDQIEGIPTEVFDGPITVTAVDTANNQAEPVTFNLTVTEASDGLIPVLDGTPVEVPRTSNPEDTGVDVTNFNPDESTITAADENGNPVEVTVDDDGNILVTPEETTGDTITVTITDPDLDEEETFDVQVVDPATEADLLAPTYDPVIVAQDETTTVSSPTFVDESGEDTQSPEGTTFTTGETSPPWAEINTENGAIILTPSADEKDVANYAPAGVHIIPVVVTYPDGSTDETTVNVTITPAEDEDPGEQSPSITDIDNQTGTVGEVFGPVAIDISGEDITVTVTGLPEGLVYNEADTTVEGTPTTATDAPATVTVTVTNEYGTDTETFEISVAAADAPVEDAPSFGGSPNPVNPTDERQDTGLDLNDPTDGTEVEARDGTDNEIPVEVDEDGNIWVTPGEDVEGPITIIITDPGLEDPIIETVPVNPAEEDPGYTGPIIDNSNVNPVDPTDEPQDTGIDVTDPSDGTTVDATDEADKDIPVEIDENGNVIVTPGEDVEGPITVVIDDPALDAPIEVEVPVTEVDDPIVDAPSITGTPNEVNPSNIWQDTGLNLNDEGEGTTTTARDEDNQNVPVIVDENGVIRVSPGEDVDGPITITVTDPALDSPLTVEVPVTGHEEGRDDNNSGEVDTDLEVGSSGSWITNFLGLFVGLLGLGGIFAGIMEFMHQNGLLGQAEDQWWMNLTRR